MAQVAKAPAPAPRALAAADDMARPAIRDLAATTQSLKSSDSRSQISFLAGLAAVGRSNHFCSWNVPNSAAVAVTEYYSSAVVPVLMPTETGNSNHTASVQS